MNKRKNIGKRLRFKVFHRDDFRCRYCGQSSDNAILHIDHVVAVSNGGTNDMENLVTACAACNLGKGATAITNWPSRAGPVKCPFSEGWPYDIEDPVYYANSTWAVTGYGLESLVTFYPIEAARLADKRDGMSDWLLHLAEKEHFAERYDDLVDAFTRALARHSVEHTFDLQTSINIGKREALETLRWSDRP